MKIRGIHHIKLTVRDLGISKEFYVRVFGLSVVAQYEDFVMLFGGSFYLGLTTHKGNLDQKMFNERNVGMDHVAFEVESLRDLEVAVALFDREKIPHGEITKLSNGMLVLAFRDPDNVQLELAWKE